MNKRPQTDNEIELLKKKCFKQNLNTDLKDTYKRSWAMRYPIYVTHKISIRIVRLLLRTPIRPNQVTTFSYVCGLVAGYFFLTAQSKLGLLAGVALFELYYIFDAVDGQLARARNHKSRGGGVFDEWGNFLVAPFVIACIGFNPAFADFHPLVVCLAVYAILSLPIIEMVRDRWFDTQARTHANPQANRREGSHAGLKLVYSLAYRSATMPVVMNTVSVLSVGMLAFADFPLWEMSPLGYLVLYYATAGTLVWMIKVMKLARMR